MLKGLVLIGGNSTRFQGRHKAWLDLHGTPQYKHIFNLLSSLQLPTFISCRKEQIPLIDSELPTIADTYQEIGPMGGIVTAMEYDNEADWLVVACDLLLLNEVTVAQLMNTIDRQVDVITFKKRESTYPETTISIYKHTVYPYMKEALRNGKYSLQAIIKKVSTNFVLPTNEASLLNVNTNEDYKKLKSALQNKEGKG